MKPSRLFVSVEDFSNRFKDTFIYYNGVPMFVQSCTFLKHGDMDTLVFNAHAFKDSYDPDNEPKVIYLNDEGVNFRNYNIGYTHYNDLCSQWIARAPARQWKQGLRKDQCQVVGYVEDALYSVLLPNRYTYDMLMNSYVTVEKALSVIKQQTGKPRPVKFIKIPIHKNFAIFGGRYSNGVGIEYKGVVISSDEKDKPVLMEQYRYLLDIPEYAKLLSWIN